MQRKTTAASCLRYVQNGDCFERQWTTSQNSDYEELLNKKDCKNTNKSTKIAVNVFRDYIQEKELDIHFAHIEKSAQASILAKFYVEVRKNYFNKWRFLQVE